MPFGKKATTKKAKKQKAKEAPSKRTKEIGGPNMSYSPTKMESAKQEKYNLMHDNPVAKDASGGRDASWMSKHSKYAIHMGHSPAEMGHDSPAQHKGSVHGAKHSEEVGHDGTGIHSHASGSQKKRDDQMAAAEKRKKVKATLKAGEAIAKSM